MLTADTDIRFFFLWN